MIDIKTIENLARHVHNAMPISFRDLGYDLENKILHILQSQLMQLDLVNRAEFDIQAQTLLHLQEKLAILEQRVVILEQRS
ncbi:ubiquinone biosynthesis accessory factor UbiK [Candidatus Erwinia haradaeae]|uniref:Ubiquinone biosynthesis accessory factor UbiK n=1 Tax=Candidatus Erwinia haradaeae TaxID=1922217 RepID=A0A451DCI4_9GAMM|nr:accessory factor UbiK family protein [Candidatus Erwinia haradaeae]VFP84143.1 ubiquinone biosynthesis accessory factor UbiK [Candidatus Erwinia haradaeae]